MQSGSSHAKPAPTKPADEGSAPFPPAAMPSTAEPSSPPWKWLYLRALLGAGAAVGGILMVPALLGAPGVAAGVAAEARLPKAALSGVLERVHGAAQLQRPLTASTEPAPATALSASSGVVGTASAQAPGRNAVDLPAVEAEHLAPVALTPELIQKGYHACNPPDPMGLGPYQPYVPLSTGRLAVPQRDGHTDDFGYDVLIHFHGSDAIRKTLVQVTRGVTLALVDKGNGSGPYEAAFQAPSAFEILRTSIESGLKRQSGDPRAHIRHLGLSGWSAGYGAIVQILRHHAAAIDAVVLLDGLHAGWKPGTSVYQRKQAENIMGLGVAPALDFARTALTGQKIFILTHSHIDPVSYPSVALTASWLLNSLGLERSPVEPGPGRADPAAALLLQKSTVDQGGFHLWEYAGHDEMTHCAHLALIARAVRDVIEPAWQTPAMDRTVPPTPGPLRGSSAPNARTAPVGNPDNNLPRSSPGIVLEEVRTR